MLVAFKLEPRVRVELGTSENGNKCPHQYEMSINVWNAGAWKQLSTGGCLTSFSFFLKLPLMGRLIIIYPVVGTLPNLQQWLVCMRTGKEGFEEVKTCWNILCLGGSPLREILKLTGQEENEIHPHFENRIWKILNTGKLPAATFMALAFDAMEKRLSRGVLISF